jgi:hypothetical protein
MNRDKSERKDVGTLTGEEVAKHNSKDDCWVIGELPSTNAASKHASIS